MSDHPKRSFVKTLSWRITGTLDTFIISYIVTGKPHLALSISGVEVITKLTLYYFHERVWNKIPFGKPKPNANDYQI